MIRHDSKLRHLLTFVVSLLCLVVLGGSALAFEAPQALQNQNAWTYARRAPSDCEEAYRSFRARTTLSPSRRRKLRKRCLAAEQVRHSEGQAQKEQRPAEHEVVLED